MNTNEIEITETELPNYGGPRRVRLEATYEGQKFRLHWFDEIPIRRRTINYVRQQLLRDIEQFKRTGKKS